MKLDAALRWISASVPAIAAAAAAESVARAANDADLVRAVGLSSTGPWRCLDLLVAAPAMLLPIGTRALRAGLASSLILALVGFVAFDVARHLADRVVPKVLTRLGKGAAPPSLLAAACAALVLTALLSPLVQSEATAPGGAVTGVLLVLLAARLAIDASSSPAPLALVLALSLSYEPLVFVAASAASAPFVRRPSGPEVLRCVVSAVLGLLPLALPFALAFRSPDLVVTPAVASPPTPLLSLVSSELGTLLGAATLLGALLSLTVPDTRRAAASLLLVIGVGVFAMRTGASERGAPVLAALVVAHLLAAVALAGVVLAVARAPLPFAQASAALIVVLELVLPVRAIDETFTRAGARAPRAATAWNEVAWGTLPPASVLLAPDANLWRRIAAARVAGEMREDIVVVPIFDLRSRAARRALALEPSLAALYRDVALGSAPEELSFNQLTGKRAVAGVFDPTWDRALARHFVPIGLASRLEGEPRGASDRRRALDSFEPEKERLVRYTVAKRDADLTALTVFLLRARAVGIAAAGERDVLARALDDLRAFAPEDPVSKTLVRRIVTSKGAIDVRDLPR